MAETRGRSTITETQSRDRVCPVEARLWRLSRRAGGGSNLNVQIAARLRGRLDVGALDEALRAIVNRHERLRSAFVSDARGLVRLCHARSLDPLTTLDLSSRTAQEQDAAVSALLRSERDTPIALDRPPLARARLAQLHLYHHVLCWTVHEIAWDARSMAVFSGELAQLYSASRARRRTGAAPFADMRSDGRSSAASFDTDVPSAGARDAALLRTVLARGTVESLQRFAREHHVTLHAVLLAAYAVLLARVTGRSEIRLASPQSNRRSPEGDHVIGCFIDVVRLIIHIDPSMRLFDVLERVQGALRRHVPEPEVADDIPFTFSFETAPDARLHLQGVVTEIIPCPLSVHSDLELHVAESGSALATYWVHNPDAFATVRVHRLEEDYRRILGGFLADPYQPVAPCATGAPSGAVAPMPGARAPDGCVPTLFEQQARRTPDRVAAIFGASAISYAELNERANRLARVLLTRGAGPEQLVGIACHRSIELVAAILAVLKTGAACLPLDLEYPAERLEYMVREAHPLCVLSITGDVGRFAHSAPTMLMDDPSVVAACTRSSSADISSGERMRRLLPSHPAYVIFTSGSSGRPNGVVGLHSGLANRIEWFRSVRPFDEAASVLAKTSVSFIDGMTEMLGPLASGAKLVVCDEASMKDVARLDNLTRVHGVTHLTVVPSLLRVLLDEWPGAERDVCRLWISSGEALTPELVRRFDERCPSAELLNLYGMSEASGDSLWTACHEESTAFAAPIANTQVYLLNARLQLVPDGICGELYIGGAGLARGYWRRPALTAQRFVANPFAADGTRLYRTGDLGWRLPDGTLEVLGRLDRQVKIAGVRAELAEIECALTRVNGVREAVVVARTEQEEHALVAYIVSASATPVTAVGLRRALEETLPRALVPSVFISMPVLPRLPNGKIDRRALALTVPERPESPAPGLTPAEEALCRIVSEVFERDGIGPDSDFFELGGHSLHAMQLVNRIRTTLNVTLHVSTIWDMPRIGDLARLIGTSRPVDA